MKKGIRKEERIKDRDKKGQGRKEEQKEGMKGERKEKVKEEIE